MKFLGAVFIAPVLLALALIVSLATDLAWLVLGRRKPPRNTMPANVCASIVIPNWNGRDLLEKYLPAVMTAAQQNPGNEVIVVDNGSSDGSADFLRTHFPDIRVVALPENLGFGGGSNRGFEAAKNDIVVLLNSDMRVEPGFLGPLLAGFTDSDIFAVSCQIYLTDPAKRREETGLTEGCWEHGGLQVGHREDAKVLTTFPCFYAGGGSSAFDRRKFLELGGFDELFTPFYLEDTDLGYLAWKRGWKVLYQPASVVYHEHRGTIGREFNARDIDSVLKKNFLLFTWKNIHEWPRLISSLLAAWRGCVAAGIGGDRPGRANLAGIFRAAIQVFGAARSRWNARTLASVSDSEAFLRTRGSHYRDRFLPVVSGESELLRVLFVSPYPILPTSHGGAVFMRETLRELSKFCEVHALVLLDEASQVEANSKLDAYCASVEMMVRPKNQLPGSLLPHPVVEFQSRDVRWRIDRMIFQHRVDMVQVEYTPMGQYLETYNRIATALFEHDVYFQSVARNAVWMTGLARVKARIEYLRALPYELRMLKRCDQVQVCTRQNRDYLLEFEPGLASRVRAGLRACINTRHYAFPGGPRRANTLLFIGSSRHEPNRIAVEWFVEKAFPAIVSACPAVRLYLAGFTAETNLDMAASPHIEMLGTLEDVRPLLESCSVFICPVLSGSGVRVKLLEAFSAGIPVVSTRVGAEGLAEEDGGICALADRPEDFAARTIEMLRNPAAAEQTAVRARLEMEKNWDSAEVTARLYASYRELLARKAGPIPRSF
jgi:GT2 family glycosyltransferase/glycosyltransferase involved in cell wall biosynthesis